MNAGLTFGLNVRLVFFLNFTAIFFLNWRTGTRPTARQGRCGFYPRQSCLLPINVLSVTVCVYHFRDIQDLTTVTSCFADLGSCTDCQQGGLLQLGSRWYLWPAARPVAVRLECRRPFGFLSEAVRTHNPIAS